jgi:hypothetical protein
MTSSPFPGLFNVFRFACHRRSFKVLEVRQSGDLADRRRLGTELSIATSGIGGFSWRRRVKIQVDEVQMVPDGFGFHIQASEFRKEIGSRSGPRARGEGCGGCYRRQDCK